MADLSEELEEGPSREVKQERVDDAWEIEAKAGPSKYQLQQNTQWKSHAFQFRFRNCTYAVTCDTSMTVLETLMKSHIFMNIKKKNTKKDIVIQRSKGAVPRAAVKTDFPCCLIERDEILKIQFINEGNASTEQKPTDTSKPETLVTFYIHTTGGQKLRLLMKNKDLRLNVDDVCVCAFKDEDCRTALKRDGRFIDEIFKRDCVLCEMDSETIYEMSNNVEYFDQKHFKIIVISDNNQPNDSDGSAVTVDADVEKRKSTSPSSEQYAAKPMADSEEILGILRNQFPVLLEQLMERENLTKKSDVQEFFRVEYGKSVQSFNEVKKVKKLMKLSDSVCQIRREGSALGTGFLLFDRYILTNAHVIGIFADLTTIDFAEFAAVFDYEDLISEKCIQIKQLTTYFYGQDDKGMHLDYALLELDDIENIAEYPKLLDCYSPNAPTNRGQICIVGHPGEGVKKMDPCFIIERENRLETAEKHASENKHLIHLMNEVCLKNKWHSSEYENKITYDSCFFYGSSGSPVFNVDCNLIGVHTGGYVYKTQRDKTWSVMEYGFSMQPILDDIKTKALTHIVSVMEASYSNLSLTAEQQNQIDTGMKNAEESEES